MCSAAPSAVGERAEEVRHELGRQPADRFAIETAFEDAYGRPERSMRDLRAGFVHRQQETVAGDAVLVAERLAQRLAERERGVLDRVMLVDVPGRRST